MPAQQELERLPRPRLGGEFGGTAQEGTEGRNGDGGDGVSGVPEESGTSGAAEVSGVSAVSGVSGVFTPGAVGGVFTPGAVDPLSAAREASDVFTSADAPVPGSSTPVSSPSRGVSACASAPGSSRARRSSEPALAASQTVGRSWISSSAHPACTSAVSGPSGCPASCCQTLSRNGTSASFPCLRSHASTSASAKEGLVSVPPTGLGKSACRRRQLLTAARPTPASRAMPAAVTSVA